MASGHSITPRAELTRRRALTVAAAFVGSLAYEAVRSFAFDLMPQLWQMTLGSVLLLTILFLPNGLGSLVSRVKRREEAKS